MSEQKTPSEQEAAQASNVVKLDPVQLRLKRATAGASTAEVHGDIVKVEQDQKKD